MKTAAQHNAGQMGFYEFKQEVERLRKFARKLKGWERKPGLARKKKIK
jgi:hypothetical protein